MNILTASLPRQETPTAEPDSVDPVSVVCDHGLRSVQGIRWLLLVGALVVAVSVVRLVAAQWGYLPLAAQFLALATGALAVFAAGDVARHRLRLPVAGSALLYLFAAIVPLWSWGAARTGLLGAPFGGASFGLGLGLLLAAGHRLLDRTLAYRGLFYPAVLGVFLVALPVLPWLESRTGFEADSFFLAATLVLGLLLRAASRDVNRFFFHRDRLSGRERPLHLLPFALLALVYGAASSLLAAFPTHLALPLVFVAVALVDTGEEYYRALIQARGEAPARWPRRSVGLLTLGFAGMAAAVAVSTLDPGLHSAALVTTIAALRLFAWALRYRSTVAYAAALLAAMAAYHLAPVLVPEFVKELWRHALLLFGIVPGSPAVVSLADLGLLGLLLGLGVALQRRARSRFIPAMERFHAVVVALDTALLLLIGLSAPLALRSIAPLAAILLLAGLWLLRWRQLYPALYLALAASAVAWAWQPGLGLGSAAAAALPFVAGMTLVARIGLPVAEKWGFPAAGRLAEQAEMVVVAGYGLAFLAETSLDGGLFSGAEHPMLVVLALAWAGWHLRQDWLRTRCDSEVGSEDAANDGRIPHAWIAIATLQAYGAGWLAVGFPAAGLALVLAAFGERVLAEVLVRGGRPRLARWCLPAATAFGAAGGWLALHNTVAGSGSPWFPILPGFLASLFFALMAMPRTGDPRTAAYGDRVDYRALWAVLAGGFFTVSFTVLVFMVNAFGRELYCLGPGLALLGLSRLLRSRIGEAWSQRLFTLGAGGLYAMPVMGLLDELSWGWQAVLLLFAVAFGAASFRLRSPSLLIVSTGALLTDLAFFLLKLRQTEPLLLWLAGIVFGLALMAVAALLEHRREVLLQHLRIWGAEIRSWTGGPVTQ